MASFEEEYIKLKPALLKISNFALLGNKIVIKGAENFLKKGPNIIVGNHIGTFKDAATFIKIAPRQLFPISNRLIFDKKEFNIMIREHLERHMHDFGLFVYVALTPIRFLFVHFVSNAISRIGTIPTDLYNHKRMAIDKCQEYLKKGRAIVLLQGRGRVMKEDPNPYVARFRKGPSIISYNLYKEEGLSVPVTPIATLGTHLPFPIPGKIKVNIGEPMFIKDYLSGGFMETVESFRDAMEQRVNKLFFEILRSD
jgi:1-acyl-sn-glycerol-3-phosphate acyltransferase